VLLPFVTCCRCLFWWGCGALPVSAALALATPPRLRASVLEGSLAPGAVLVVLLGLLGYAGRALRLLGPVPPFLMSVALFPLFIWGIGGGFVVVLAAVAALSEPAGVGRGLRDHAAWAGAFGWGALCSYRGLRALVQALNRCRPAGTPATELGGSDDRRHPLP
jgi:hypothetical protein